MAADPTAIVAAALLALLRRRYRTGPIELTDAELDELRGGDPGVRDRLCREHGHDPAVGAIFLPTEAQD
ncbi:MAG: hypothetical protein WDA71_12045 [Actinomycetota bacterium]